MPQIRALIVDDEPLARENLQILLEEAQGIELVGQCANGLEAVEAILRLKPDLLFLDVKMPRISGFDVLQQLDPSEWPFVVFVTAYDQYALKAFEVNALDYLLKPFDDDRFALTLQRAKEQIKQRRIQEYMVRLVKLLGQEEDVDGTAAAEAQEASYATRLVIKAIGRMYFVDVDEIEWIQAAGSYVQLHTATQKHLMRISMKALEAKLDPNQFLRIHRSTLVNVAYIRELQPYFRGDYLVILKDETQLKLSRRHRHHLETLLHRTS